MSQAIQPHKGLKEIKPYAYKAPLMNKKVKEIGLASNENPFGPSPLVIEKIREMASTVHLYPDGSSKKLREALAQFYNVNAEQIICTCGSEDALTLLVRAFSGPGDEVLFSQYAFQVYDIAAKSAGAKTVRAPAPNYNVDVNSLLSCVTDKTKIVFIDNPSNPIGGYLSEKEVIRLRDGLPKHVLLVLDSAYAEYMDQPDYTAGINLVEKYDNIAMTRTFSKFYGMAGLRLGWLYAPSYIQDWVNRIRAPFCCSSLAQEAGVVALQDKGYQQKVFNNNKEVLPWFMDQLRNLGLKFIPSVTNFVLVEFDSSGPHTADFAHQALAEKGYMTRLVKGYNLANHLRITVGLKKDMEEVIEILHSFLQHKSAQYGIK